MGCQAGVSHYTVQCLRERFGELERKVVPAHNRPPPCCTLLPVVPMGVPSPGRLTAHAWAGPTTSLHAAASLPPYLDRRAHGCAVYQLVAHAGQLGAVHDAPAEVGRHGNNHVAGRIPGRARSVS